VTLLTSLFFVDFVLIGFMTYGALLFRRVEVNVMLGVGVFKDVKDMSDQEMFQEYDKMRKQSFRIKQRYRRYWLLQRQREEEKVSDR
jgi:hypothetical protein